MNERNEMLMGGRNTLKQVYLGVFLAFAFVLTSCSTQPAQKETAEKPEITLSVASLNISGHNKRIEKSDVQKLAASLKKEQVEILAVQGITRYPGVETRVDLVDQLAKTADLSNGFGEMMNNSGRQTGNAVFTSSPIRSKFNLSFENVKSARFEAAFQAIVDGGVREVHVVSAQLPKAPLEEQIACVAMVSSLKDAGRSPAVILAGNLPNSEKALGGSSFEDVQKGGGKNAATRIWYMPNEALKVVSVRSVETDFGPMLIAQFGVFRQRLP